MKRFILAIIAGAILSFPSDAADGDLTLGGYLDILGGYLDIYEKSGNEELRTLIETDIGGTESGLSWANSAIKLRKQTPLYCPPPDLSLEKRQVIAILIRFLDRYPDHKSQPADYRGLFILKSLQDAFPCD